MNFPSGDRVKGPQTLGDELNNNSFDMAICETIHEIPFQTPLTIHDVNRVQEEQGVAPTTTDSNEKCSDQEISEAVSPLFQTPSSLIINGLIT
jgi:hypothetical protein